MTLCDAGPLIAVINAGDPDHARCVDVLRAPPNEPLLVTWPCWTEAMYMLGKHRGFHAQDALWHYVAVAAVMLHTPSSDEAARMRVLMARYRDTPMDLADASIVAAAETLGLRRVFTLDSDFLVYRLGDTDSFEIVP